MIPLPASYLSRPIAHRGLHDRAAGRPENSRSAVQAAQAAGYGIEIDLQLSADGEAMVFHDYELSRLTSEKGAVRQRSAKELGQIRLLDAEDGIPTLPEVLAMVSGSVPLLIELKDQDGALGPNVGPLETRVAELLSDYSGDAAVMSFNPHAVARLAELLPDRARGLVTDPFLPEDWPVPLARLEELREIGDLERVGGSFISHNKSDLTAASVARLKASGVTILTWTIRNAAEEAEARQVADNVTFEGYLAALPA